MSASTVAGVGLIALPVLFNAAFAGLGMAFDYPDILRRPTAEVLTKFRDGGSSLIVLWWSFTVSAVLLAPLAVLVAHSLPGADATLLAIGSTTGVLAGVVQFLGLVRWPFLVPYLARVSAEPEASPARAEAVDIVFQSFNRYLGVAVGEHLGYALTGAWSILTGSALLGSSATPGWLGVVGIVIGALLCLCSLEFVGPHEENGWHLAGLLTPATYVAWSLWLVGTGIAILS